MTHANWAPPTAGTVGWEQTLLEPKINEFSTALNDLETRKATFIKPGEDINAALAAGPGEYILLPGTHNTAVPIVQPRWTKVRGSGGGATFVKATAVMAALWRIGNGAPADRTELSDLCLAANGQAAIGLEVNIVGTAGNINGEPDGQTFLHNLYVDDATDKGVYLTGSDTQAWHLREIRVRRAGNNGFHIAAPDGWVTDCEATTLNAGGAGFLVAGANGHYQGNKAWFSHGYGWNVSGTRNTFTNCEAQDTALHGWYIAFDKNAIVGCSADSAGGRTLAARQHGRWLLPGDRAQVHEPDGLHLVRPLAGRHRPAAVRLQHERQHLQHRPHRGCHHRHDRRGHGCDACHRDPGGWRHHRQWRCHLVHERQRQDQPPLTQPSR
jgi:hypothetical protein